MPYDETYERRYYYADEPEDLERLDIIGSGEAPKEKKSLSELVDEYEAIIDEITREAEAKETTPTLDKNAKTILKQQPKTGRTLPSRNHKGRGRRGEMEFGEPAYY